MIRERMYQLLVRLAISTIVVVVICDMLVSANRPTQIMLVFALITLDRLVERMIMHSDTGKGDAR